MSDLTEKERIWNVVSRLALEALPVPSHEYCEEWASKLATRAAEQLATAAVVLSEEERDSVESFVKNWQQEFPITSMVLSRLLGATK